MGDLDGDLRADIVAFQRGASPIAWVSTSTGAAFGTAYIGSADFCRDGEICAVADVDGDGRKDLLSFSHDAVPTVRIRQSAENAQMQVSFSWLQEWQSFFCTASQRCLVGNVDGRAGADVVAVSGTQIWSAIGR